MKALLDCRGKRGLITSLILIGLFSLSYYVINFKIVSRYFPSVSLIDGVQTYEVIIKGIEILTFTLLASPALFFLSLLFAPIVNPLYKKISRLLSTCSEKKFLLLLIVLSFMFAFCISRFLFHYNSTVLIRDEIGYVFQANNLAMGRLYSSALPEPIKNFFDSYHIVFDGEKVYGKYPFAHCVVLALGVVCGWIYLVPLVVTICNVLLNYKIARDFFSEKIARISSLLCVTSPFFLGYSSTLVSEGTCLLFFSLFILFFLKSIKNSGSILHPATAGLFLGLGFNTRPATIVALTIPFICYGFYLIYKRKRYHVRSFMFIILTFSVMLGVFFTYNTLLTGNPFLMPFSTYASSDRVGFGTEVGGAAKEWGPEPRGHTPFKGLKNSLFNILILNTWFCWFYPLLIPLVFLLFVSKKASEWDWLFLGMIVSLVGFFFFYWFEGVSLMGPIYYFGAILPITIMSSRSISILFERLTETMKSLVIIFCLLTCFTLIFLVNYDSFEFASLATKMKGRLYEKIKKEEIHNAVIFIEHKEKPLFMGYRGYNPKLLYYLNHPTFETDIVFAQDFEKDNITLMEVYPQRKYYLYDEYDNMLYEIEKDKYKE